VYLLLHLLQLTSEQLTSQSLKQDTDMEFPDDDIEMSKHLGVYIV
jgi:hypothetical protein